MNETHGSFSISHLSIHIEKLLQYQLFKRFKKDRQTVIIIKNFFS